MKTIKSKLILCIGFFVVLASVMAVVTIVTVSKQEDDSKVLNFAGKQRMLSQKMVKEFYVYYGDSGEDEAVNQAKKAALQKTADLFDRTLTALIEGDAEFGLPPMQDAEVRDLLIKSKALWGKFHEVINRGMSEGFFDEDEQFLNENNLTLLKEANAATMLLAAKSKEKVVQLERMQYAFILVALIAGGAVFMFMLQTVIKPLYAIQDKVKRISADRDLVSRIDESQDEIGELAKGFNGFLSEFQGLLTQVSNATNLVHQSSTELTSASEQMASGAHNQEQQMVAVATAVEQMSATVTDVARNSTEAFKSAAEASQVARDGGDVVTQTISGMNRIASSVSDSANIIQALGQSSDQIGAIVAVIEQIAEQTNLLALNAAIEAARAGEQGRGFAVVADEVRNLAGRTGDATKEIASMISGIQRDTEAAVHAMDTGTKEVASGVELANKAGDSLTQIVSVVANVTDMVQHIATAAEEQSVVADDIAKNVDAVAMISQETSSSVGQASSANQVLSDQVSELRARVQQFKL